MNPPLLETEADAGAIPLERVERSSEAPEASTLSAELQGHAKLVYHIGLDSAKQARLPCPSLPFAAHDAIMGPAWMPRVLNVPTRAQSVRGKSVSQEVMYRASHSLVNRASRRDAGSKKQFPQSPD